MKWFTELDDDAQFFMMYFGFGAVIVVCMAAIKIAQAFNGVSE